MNIIKNYIQIAINSASFRKVSTNKDLEENNIEQSIEFKKKKNQSPID